MPGADALTTTLSSKGQVILPAAIRKRRQWSAGTRLSVEETPEGVLLKPAPLFPRTTPEQVFGCLQYSGRPKTLDEMQAGIAAEARRRHARGRY
jgi:AbrB family looped-hinge helix DNA binding protein